jgi:hypothetical protein
MKSALPHSILVVLLLAVAVGCASSNDYQSGGGYNENREASYTQDPEPPNNSRAHPAAYAMDSFIIRKKRPKRSPASEMKFFFKNCEQGGEKAYYSRTSYSCDMPY